MLTIRLDIKFNWLQYTNFIPDVRSVTLRDDCACSFPLSQACSAVTLNDALFYMKKKDWFRLKRYPHIGPQFQPNDRKWIGSYVKDEDAITKHSFYPFIHLKLSDKRFRRAKFDDGTRSDERIIGIKKREVFYASHLDALIYSYYSEILSNKYDDYLKNKPVSDSVTAYRKIKLNNKPKSRNKCSIDFANDIFKYIKANKDKNLVAITFDITSFFDNLDHYILKQAWMTVIGKTDQLPEHHYAVFRNLTKFSYVEMEDMFEEFKDDMYVKKKDGSVVKKAITKIELLKEKNAVSFCDGNDEFKTRVRGKKLIKNNKWIKDENGNKTLRKKGIPQGSPISATLANIYMIDFDTIVNKSISKMGGLYQRYSDDMVAIVEEQHMHNVISLFQKKVKESKLEIQPSKTQVFLFKKFNGIYECREYDLKTKKLSNKYKFDYLGFSFDGNHVYIKHSALSKYYRKMKRSIRRGGFFAKYGKNKTPFLFKGRLYKRFTHLGSNRRTIYKRDPKNNEKWIKSHKHDWGNFLTYSNLAYSIFNDKKIKKQVGRSWNIFHNLVSEKQKEVDRYHKNRNKRLIITKKK